MSNVTTADIALMGEAIALAAEGDAPFGAVIVKDGRVLARGRNSGKRLKDPTAHAEMVAIRHCLAEHGPEILRGATIYTSGEPCPMCTAALLWARIGGIVFASSSFGAPAAAGIDPIKLSAKDVIDATPFYKPMLQGGVLAAETDRMFRERPR